MGCHLRAQDSLGLILNTAASYPGYTLFSPFFTTNTYLIDQNGKAVKTWNTGMKPGANEMLLENGQLLKASKLVSGDFKVSGKGGLIQKFNSEGIVVWSYQILDDRYCQHHSILQMPNGNIMAIVWEKIDKMEALEWGRSPKNVDFEVYMLMLMELRPDEGNQAQIVWEWHSKDHLVQDFDQSKQNYQPVSEHPELIDFNYVVRDHNKKDFLHTNSIDYHADKDLIILSVRAMDEIWVIDHSTNSAEASQHSGGNYKSGGDLIFRWGNPKAYQSREDNTQTLFGQHDAQWITNGKYKDKVIVFNNGRDSIRPWSSVDVIDIQLPDTAVGGASTSANLIWRYEAQKKEDFYSTFISGVQILPNGNMLITEGQKGRIFEIDDQKKIVWEFVSPHLGFSGNDYQSKNTKQDRYVYKATKYGLDYPGVVNLLKE